MNSPRFLNCPRLLIASFLLPLGLSAQVSLSSSTYTQNFDTLAGGTSDVTWTQNSTLSGWYLFTSDGTAPSVYRPSTGSSGALAQRKFQSLGTTTSATDRALGAFTSGDLYWGSPVPSEGAVAGWIAVAMTNDSGGAFSSFTVDYTGEQWRDANAAAQAVTLEYGFGSTYTGVSWTVAGSEFDFSSPIHGGTGNQLDGNLDANRLTGIGGTIGSISWQEGETLWVRWAFLNNTGDDHSLAIDGFSLSASAIPEPATASVIAGLVFLGFAALRRPGKKSVD